MEKHDRRIDCPIDWCEGRWTDHGGEGQAPEKWDHSGAYIDLGDGLPRNSRASVHRVQWGSGPAEWSGEIQLSPELFEQRGVSAVAATLRQLAAEIEEVTGANDE